MDLTKEPLDFEEVPAASAQAGTFIDAIGVKVYGGQVADLRTAAIFKRKVIDEAGGGEIVVQPASAARDPSIGGGANCIIPRIESVAELSLEK
jgi:hypothetical protein